ncbi:MAG TPA: undecaprenyl-diphosphate phosphatase [Caulobacteraceae bacterium]|jgi:undecaprenyl-diphosphatase|nr:undecaprenyl-diphosphate phosphatase [Caulobacteraceae bacterium]
MTAIQAIVLAIVQGITELFPISSLGHAVLLPALLHWNVDENGAGFLPFLVVMHLGTAFALIVYFWRDWWDFALAILVRRGPKAVAERRLFLQVVVATIPAVVIGFVFEHLLKRGFGSPKLAAAFLIANGLMLFAAERLKGHGEHRSLDRLGWGNALIIGFCQCLALIPGLSRSGATMAGGYLVGLDHEDAARFSFLTATPVILGAGVLEAPKLLHHGGGGFSGVAILAGAVAGVVAFLSAALLMRWFRGHEAKAFDPFALYCGLAGAGALAWLTLVH